MQAAVPFKLCILTACGVGWPLPSFCNRNGAKKKKKKHRWGISCVPEFVTGKPLCEMSTWGIGGPAELYFEAHNEKDMALCIRYCHSHNIRFMVVGKGSNCLFDDRGFKGCIILNRINMIEENGSGFYRVGSGYPFNLLGLQTVKQGFGGLEFAGGIPGSVGGAVFMNAGANGQDTAKVLQAVEFVDWNGEKHTFHKDKKEMVFGYRKSPFVEMRGAIVAATFQLQPCVDAWNRQKAYLNRRKKTQPVKEKSVGCVFRNPKGSYHSAGALIEKAGLKGVAIGGACVSELHANFVVNVGGATCNDVLCLISLVKASVKEKFEIELVEEVHYVPYD